ncbi:MAG: pilus assembly protein [Clostridia bacterium]|nr:pilus assembly protein [Clostridia bacterium]
MLKWLKSLRKTEKGQSTVEMALVLPIVILLLFGIMEFGRIFNAYLIITNAAREGARAGVVGASDAAIRSAATATAGTLDTVAMSVYITPASYLRVRGASLTVEIEYPVRVFTPVINNFTGDPFVVNARTTMRVE